ncbi:MAG: alkaline phosphatase family protein [Planctomycetes bacterium]|nr:alkaline phosphatase family protein [Planctomycetota bacterium]
MARRAVMLGLDALVPNTTEKFLGEGILPNFAKLLSRGSFTRVRPVIPAQTPANWHTLATGASPGTHGITVWGGHVPGDPVYENYRSEAFNGGICRAEYIWEAAERAGRTSVVINYAGYPPESRNSVFVDWLFQPARSYFDLAAATTYHNIPSVNTTDPVELVPAGEDEPSDSGRRPLSCTIGVLTSEEGTGPEFEMLVVAGNGSYDRVLLRDPGDASVVAELAVGEWSAWVERPFVNRTGAGTTGAFRFKLVELSPDAGRIRLYRTPAFPVDGRHISDPTVAEAVMRECGPYVHSAMSITQHVDGAIDGPTMDEIMAQEADWWAGAAAIAAKSLDASLIVLHWHNLDAMGHEFVQFIDPTGPQYDPGTADAYWDIIREYYKAADRFVGRFIDKFDDGDTVFAIVSDHGMPANRKAVSLVNAFLDRGWLVTTVDGLGLDWASSKLFIDQNHIWINLLGRNRGGIVPPDEYRDLRSEIIAAMRDIKDPDTGEHVFAFVLSRDDAPMVGLWGELIGDIVYCYSGGYRWAGDAVLRMNEKRVVFPCDGGNHGPMVPTYETADTSVMGALLLGGPGVRCGVSVERSLQFRVSAMDLAPTLCRLIGIDRPAQAEGRVLHEFLEDGFCGKRSRKFVSTARSIVSRKPAKQREVRLKGDVTDET